MSTAAHDRRSKPGGVLRRAAIFVLLSFVAGCGADVAGPSERAAESAADADVLALVYGEAGAPMLQADRPATLDHLLQVAFGRVAAAQGRAAAEALMATLTPLRQAARAAAEAGDRNALRGALLALQHAQARIVIDHLGTAALDRLLEAAAAMHTQLTAQLARSRSTVRDPAAAAAALDHAVALLAAARRARGEDPARALLLAAHGAEALGRLRLAWMPPPAQTQAVTALPALLERARAHVVRTEGADAARRLFAPLAAAADRLHAARSNGDRAAIDAAIAALRTEQLRAVVAALGAEPPTRLLDAAAGWLAAAAERVEALRRAGRDVARFEAAIREAAAVHARGSAALEAGDLVGALDAALDAAVRAHALVLAIGR